MHARIKLPVRHLQIPVAVVPAVAVAVVAITPAATVPVCHLLSAS